MQWGAGEKHFRSVQVVYGIFRWEELRVGKGGIGGFGEKKAWENGSKMCKQAADQDTCLAMFCA